MQHVIKQRQKEQDCNINTNGKCMIETNGSLNRNDFASWECIMDQSLVRKGYWGCIKQEKDAA